MLCQHLQLHSHATRPFHLAWSICNRLPCLKSKCCVTVLQKHPRFSFVFLFLPYWCCNLGSRPICRLPFTFAGFSVDSSSVLRIWAPVLPVRGSFMLNTKILFENQVITHAVWLALYSFLQHSSCIASDLSCNNDSLVYCLIKSPEQKDWIRSYIRSISTCKFNMVEVCVLHMSLSSCCFECVSHHPA